MLASAGEASFAFIHIVFAFAGAFGLLQGGLDLEIIIFKPAAPPGFQIVGLFFRFFGVAFGCQAGAKSGF